ncbi:MAG: hypothetical protein JNM07_04360 [Phycisphaerae bacterium]|nr:hypothetical protein [Phycisphaerae bacterium]
MKVRSGQLSVRLVLVAAAGSAASGGGAWAQVVPPVPPPVAPAPEWTPPPPPEPAPPPEPEKPDPSLIKRDASGNLEIIKGNPEEAGLALLDLTPEQRASAERVLAARRIQFEQIVLANLPTALDLRRKLTTGAKIDTPTEMRNVNDQVRKLDSAEPLSSQLQRDNAIPAKEAQRLSRVAKSYNDAVRDEQRKKVDTKDMTAMVNLIGRFAAESKTYEAFAALDRLIDASGKKDAFASLSDDLKREALEASFRATHPGVDLTPPKPVAPAATPSGTPANRTNPTPPRRPAPPPPPAGTKGGG